MILLQYFVLGLFLLDQIGKIRKLNYLDTGHSLHFYMFF